MATKRRIGNLGKLSDFGSTAPSKSALPSPQAEPEPQTVQPDPQPPQPEETTVPSYQADPPPSEEKLSTVNIKLYRSSHQWLNETARLIRDQNEEPVPPKQRVYPQHLIQAAIDLLREQDIDWEQVRTVDDLKRLIS